MTVMCSLKSTGLSLVIMTVLLYIANSYPDSDMSNTGCEECKLKKNVVISDILNVPIFQCVGCCFSRAYPTPLRSKNNMLVAKNITSEATCCVSKESHPLPSHKSIRNHTECHCSTCYYHKSP